MPATYRIGISGWRYPPWRKTFFPADLPQKDELAYASRHLNSIEINGTFYSLQRPSSYQTWYEQTPENFLFSVKGPRYVTHIRRLKDVAGPLANFFASGVLRLREKLGPFLWQLPPSLPFDAARLSEFFQLLPRDTDAAIALARRHDAFLTQTWYQPDKTAQPGKPAKSESAQPRPLRHALEIRHASFATPEFVALLREHNIAVVVADTAGKWPLIEDVTSDFIYVRLHGDEELYVSGYTDEALRAWEKKLRTWHRGANVPSPHRLAGPAPTRSLGRDIFTYFDNDVKVRAPYDAMTLAHRLGIGPAPGAPPPIASIAEKPRTASEWPWRFRRGTKRTVPGTKPLPRPKGRASAGAKSRVSSRSLPKRPKRNSAHEKGPAVRGLFVFW